VVYKNNDIRLELSRLARIVDPKMKLQGDVVFKCENVPTLDPISFETPDSFLALPKWTTKRVGSISFDFRTSEANGLILFTHGKPQDRRDAKGQKNNKVDFFAVELLDGGLYLLLDMGSGTIKVKATQAKVNDGAWHHVDIQRDGRSGKEGVRNRFAAVNDSYIKLMFIISVKRGRRGSCLDISLMNRADEATGKYSLVLYDYINTRKGVIIIIIIIIIKNFICRALFI